MTLKLLGVRYLDQINNRDSRPRCGLKVEPETGLGHSLYSLRHTAIELDNATVKKEKDTVCTPMFDTSNANTGRK